MIRAVIVMGAVLLVGFFVFGAFVLSSRRAIFESVEPTLEPRILTSPPRLELVVSVAPTAPAIRVESISLPRAAAEELGAAPPAGFRLAPTPVLDRESFEADLEPLVEEGGELTEERVEAYEDREFEEHRCMLEDHHRNFVSFDGRRVVRPGERAQLTIPLSRTGSVEGNVSILYSWRSGLVRDSQGTDAPLNGRGEAHEAARATTVR